MSPGLCNHTSEDQCQTRLRELVLQTQQLCISENKSISFLNAVFHRLEETGYDLNFFKVAQEHAKVIQVVISQNNQDYKNLKFRSHEECLSYYIAKIFFDKLLLYQTFSYPVKINYDVPIKVLPIQAFLKEDHEARLRFEKTLKQYDVLYAEVLKTVSVQPVGNENDEFVELRIISKVIFNDKIENELLYHLNSHVFMFKNLEFTRLGRTEFSASEVFKVTVLNKLSSKNNRIFVTTNNDALRIPLSQKRSAVLGFVPPEDMPFDLNCFKIAHNFQGYSNYLHSQPTFYYSLNLKDEIASLGIDHNRIYSFCISRDGMTISPNKTAASLYENAKVAMHAESPIHLAKAKQFVEEDNLTKAEESFKDSLKSWPENYQVFEMRGKMYFEKCKKKERRGKILTKAVLDFETALELNPSASEPKRCLSKIFTYVSKRLIKNKEYDSAKNCVQISLKLYPENDEAISLLQKIDERKDEDFYTLKMRRKLIKKQLKKENN